MKLLFSWVIFLVCLTMYGQQAFKSGEKLTYSASYNMSGLMTDLAQVSMEVNRVQTSKSSLLHLKCKASTYSKWDNFFKIRDLYESYWSTRTFLPLLHVRDIQEGNYAKQIKYKFNFGTKTVESTLNKKGYNNRKQELKIGTDTFDAITTFYKIRNMDIANAAPGISKTFTILFDEKENPVKVTYVGKETLKVAGMGEKECYKLYIPVEGGKFSGHVWLTADANKVPVLFKFNIPIGSGQLRLVAAEGLAN